MRHQAQHLLLHDSEWQVRDLIINNIMERLRALELALEQLDSKKRAKTKRDLDEIGLVNPNYCKKSSVKRRKGRK